MKTYRVKIKGGTKTDTLKARSELEAKVLFCARHGLDYRVYAGNLEVVSKAKGG